MDRLRHLVLSGATGLGRRLGRRLTPAGRLALAGLAASAVLGLDTNESMAFQTFTFLLALLGLAALCTLRWRPRLELRRSLPRFGTAGEPMPYLVFVRNLGRGAARGWSLREQAQDPRPSLAEFSAARAAADREMPWVDRILGFNRWRRLLRSQALVRPSQAPVPDLPPGGSCEVPASLVPVRRGRLHFLGVSVARPDPLGLCHSLALHSAAADLIILPKRYPVPRLELSGTRRYQQGGVALSSSVGESPEFMSLRDYRPGDPMRRIHWRSWAKRGKPVVREYQDEYFVRHALVLDTFLEGGREELFEEAVSVAASFASTVLTQESLLDLLFVGTQAYCFTAGRGLGGCERMLEVLAGVQVCPDRDFDRLRQSVVRRHATMSGCICVLLGWDEARQGLIRHLRSLGVPVVPLVLVDPAGEKVEGEGFHRLELGRVAEGLARLS